MNTVTVGVTSHEEINARFRRAMNGEPQGAFRGFETIEDLWETLTLKRWAILQTLTGSGPLALWEIARRVGRKVESVEADVQALVNAGFLEKLDDGRTEFPFDAVHVDFMLRAVS
jgi:predicted transcriptional regulator